MAYRFYYVVFFLICLLVRHSVGQTAQTVNIPSDKDTYTQEGDGKETNPVISILMLIIIIIIITDDANTNFGTATTDLIQLSSNGDTKYAYVEFNISSITSNPANCISQVEIYLYLGQENNWKRQDSGFDVTFNYIDPNSWGEYTLTWDNQNSVVIYASDPITLSTWQTGNTYVSGCLNFSSVQTAISSYNSQVFFFF